MGKVEEFAINKVSLNKNPFIGLFMRANDELFFCSKTAPAAFKKQAESVLKARELDLFVGDSVLVGIFTALNSKGCVLPNFIEKKELEAVKKSGLNACVLDCNFAPGNNVLANDKAAVIHPFIPESEARKIADCLGVEVHRSALAGLRTIGSANVVTNKGFLAFNETSEVELKQMEKWFGVRGSIGTSNMGVPFNSLSVVANKHGALVGELTSGFETQRIYQALG